MKNFSDYLEAVKNSRTLLSEEAVLKNEMITFFEENEIIYDEELLESMRDLVFMMEGINLKEKFEKVKSFMSSGIQKIADIAGNKKVQAIALLVLAAILINAGMDAKAKELVSQCNTMCGSADVSWSLIAKKIAGLIKSANITFEEEGLQSAIDAVTGGGKIILKNIWTKLSSDPNVIKTLSAMSGLFGIKKGIESAN